MSNALAPPALACSKITKRFGALIANDHIDFDVRLGEIHGLVGENGAGKTTLMSVLYGIVSPDEGTIAVNGHPVRFHNCADAMRAGIGMVFQHFLLVERFSVADNVLLGAEPQRLGWVDRRAMLEKVKETSARFRFALDPLATVEDLGVSARQQVELLRVLERNPRIVILDEPTASLSPLEVDSLFGVMHRLRQEGKAIIFITHKLKEVMRLCDRVTVLRRGRVVGTASRSEMDETRLATMMIGSSQPVVGHSQRRAPLGDVALSVKDLTVLRDDGSPAVKSLSLEVRAGEIVGVAGVEGSGQQQFAEALYGLRPSSSGGVWLQNVDLTNANVAERRRAGVRYISPDRQREGLVLEFDALENSLLGDERSLSGSVLLDTALGASRAADIAARFGIEPYEPSAPLRSYSGGTQQKFLVGRESSGGLRLVIAHSPTRGVDISAAERIYERLQELRDQGVSVLLISYDLDEIRLLADRVIVFHNGKIAGEVQPAEADDATLGRLMASGVR